MSGAFFHTLFKILPVKVQAMWTNPSTNLAQFIFFEPTKLQP